MPTASANGIELHYEEQGEGPPVVLIMGIGAQLIHWPDGFCDSLAEQGVRVIRFDNRDIGLSTWLDDLGVPNLRWLTIRALARLPVSAKYTLYDMADDTAGLLDALSLPSAHVVGCSMGGMVAQCFAIRHPTRTRTLTSMMSTTGHRRFKPTLKAARVLLGRAPRSREEAADRSVEAFGVIGSPGYVRDEDYLRELAMRAYDRAHHPRGFVRQGAAILATGDRTKPLRGVRCSTLVIHGASDPLVPPAAGKATAKAIPNARLELMPGMGHDLPRALWPTFARLIAEQARAHESSKVAG